MQFHYRIETIIPATQYLPRERYVQFHHRIETIIAATQYTAEEEVCAVSLQNRDHNSSYTDYSRRRGMCSFITE